MKKNYKQPQMEVITIATTNMLASSPQFNIHSSGGSFGSAEGREMDGEYDDF